MRNSCGCGDQPNTKVFQQVFRLLLTYNLIKPFAPKGSNVSNDEPHISLVELSLPRKKTARESWEVIAEKITNSCDDFEDQQDVVYDVETVDDNIRFYVAG